MTLSETKAVPTQEPPAPPGARPRSPRTGRRFTPRDRRNLRVGLDDLLEEARTEALDSETDDAARHRLTAWPTVREALRRP